ncbi:hypothetical protein FA15DRAFT_625528 [Coprinopsis marcescibilis]|uniref:INO80 complex subunit F domain-containing protein n=1 Tax=Coprinopsis marcescibilis TaxID=230819 RepID=A0A5C3KWP5_COPMA|nr:hypothetical protein FA15DRAFT_625528 [Coprinopsis marcescibilis]
MSRNPSPAPPSVHHTPQQSSSSIRQKQKPFAISINAGAEDVRYQAKYKDLKRKVKDVETENDKLHSKVMNAKLTIQRMKMERAILYERLALAPNSPSGQDRVALPGGHPSSGVPPHQPPSAVHHHRDAPDHLSASVEPDQPFTAYQEYIPRSRGTPTQPQSLEGRSASTVDNPPSSHMSINQSPIHLSAEHDSRQRLPAARHIPAGMAPPFDGHQNRSHSSSHASPPMEHEYPPPSHHIRTRSQSSSRSRTHQMQPSSYREGQYPEMQSQAFSPPLSDRERSRHPDMRNMPPQGDPLPHHQPPLAQMSPQSSTSDLRRMHPHQRVGPGTYINRDEYPDRQRDLDRERDWDHERASRDLARNREIPSAMHSPHSVPRSRQPMDRTDYPDHHMSSREEQPPYFDGPPQSNRAYTLVSGSGSPGSGSASGSGGGLNEDSSRPDSRTQFYEGQQQPQQDRNRAGFRLRPVGTNQQSEDVDFMHEDARPQPRADRAPVNSGQPPSGGGSFPLPEQNLPSTESRKRSRSEVDVDGENDVVANTSQGTSHYRGGPPGEDPPPPPESYRRASRRRVPEDSWDAGQS